MTTPLPRSDRARRHAEQVVELSRAILARPDDMLARRAFAKRCFNIDWLAAAIVTLADSREPAP